MAKYKNDFFAIHRAVVANQIVLLHMAGEGMQIDGSASVGNLSPALLDHFDFALLNDRG